MPFNHRFQSQRKSLKEWVQELRESGLGNLFENVFEFQCRTNGMFVVRPVRELISKGPEEPQKSPESEFCAESSQNIDSTLLVEFQQKLQESQQNLEVSHSKLKVMAKELNDERRRASANTEETIAASRAKDQMQKKLHEALAETAELKGELLAKAQEHDESRKKTHMTKISDDKKIQSLTDKLKRLEKKLLDSQANETNAREMIDILNATLEKQKEHGTQVSDISKELYLAHQKLGSLEKELEMKDTQISMRDDELKKTHDLQKALDIKIANQATNIQSLESETRSLKDQLELAKPDSFNRKEESEKVEDVDQERQEDPNNRENSHQEEQPNSMHLEGFNRVVLQTQDQERQLMSLEDMDLERQLANQQHALRAFSDPKPIPSEWGYDSNDSGDSKITSIRSESVQEGQRAVCVYGFPCPSEKCRDEDGDHWFNDYLDEFANDDRCEMCACNLKDDAYYLKTGLIFSCDFCDALICRNCHCVYQTGEASILRHPDDFQEIVGSDQKFKTLELKVEKIREVIEKKGPSAVYLMQCPLGTSR